MEAENGEEAQRTVTDTIKGAKDALTVRRVFGNAYKVGEAQIIPVAKVAGGAGGGGGEGNKPDETGSGFGTGFGIGAIPVGVYEVRDGVTEWKPAVDVNRAIRGGQVLVGIVAVCVTLVLLARRR
jgi:uncharacterized spore protein YtfJ